MKNEEIDKFIKENVEHAVSNFKKEMDISEKCSSILKFFQERKFNMYHPDVSPELREHIFDLMNRWPRVSFIDHCLITHFFTIRESPDITYEINPQGSGDELPIGDVNLLNRLYKDNDDRF